MMSACGKQGRISSWAFLKCAELTCSAGASPLRVGLDEDELCPGCLTDRLQSTQGSRVRPGGRSGRRPVEEGVPKLSGFTCPLDDDRDRKFRDLGACGLRLILVRSRLSRIVVVTDVTAGPARCRREAARWSAGPSPESTPSMEPLRLVIAWMSVAA